MNNHNNDDAPEGFPDLNDTEQDVVEAITLLIAGVMPQIDKEETYDIITKMLDEGMTIDNVESWGKRIRMTATGPSKRSH